MNLEARIARLESIESDDYLLFIDEDGYPVYDDEMLSNDIDEALGIYDED